VSRYRRGRYTEDQWAAILAARVELNPHADERNRKDGHVEYVCGGKGLLCEEGRCQFCEGGLFACDVCGGFEGAATTDCPGRTVHLADEVYAGRLDYRAGCWVAGPSLWSPALFRMACERAGVTP
jgi:hypothetical protein